MKRTKLQTNKSSVPTPNKEQIQTLGVLATRMAYAARLGIQYDGKRDLFQALGYTEELTPQMYFTQFKRQDIANAIINRPIRDTWKGGLSLIEVDDKNETEFERVWQKLCKDLQLVNRFVRLDRLTGLSRYGIMLLGLDDVQEREQFSTPVKEGARKLMYVKVLGEKDVTISTYITNTKDERFGLPLMYTVNLVNATGEGYSMNVHYSRILHVVDGVVDNECFGTPRLEVVFNRLQDLEKLVGGSAEMFWRGARPGYQGKVDPDYTMGTEEEAQLQDQIDEYEHNLRRMFVNEGVDLKALEMQIGDPLNHVDVQIQMISAVTGIPKRILTGSERGELSSGQDSDEWNKLIASRREDFAEPVIVRAFVDLCVKYGILPKPKNDYTVQWSDLFSVSEKERVDVGNTRASALNAYSSNAIAQSVVSPDAFFEFFLGFTQDQIDLIKQMQKDIVPLETPVTPEEQALLDEEDIVTQGGEGSGNFGHAGIPGHQGGSINRTWKKEQLTIEGSSIPFLKNPDFQKPEESVTLFHETNNENVSAIMKNGLDAEISGSVWFTESSVFKQGIREGYKAGDVFVVQIPKNLISKSEQGIEVFESIPVSWIKGVLQNNKALLE